MKSQNGITEARLAGKDWLKRHFSGSLMVVGVLAVVVGLGMFLPRRSDDKAAVALPAVPVSVQVIQATPEVVDSFRILGSVEPVSIVNLAAEVPGRIVAYAGKADRVVSTRSGCVVKKGPASAGVLDEGDIVRAGQPILYLDTDLLQADCNRSQADYDFACREAVRLEKAFAKGVATKAELDAILKRRDVARAAFDSCRARLDRTIITAPSPGVLNKLPAEVGEYVQPGSDVAQIVDIRSVKVVLDIPERDVSYLKVGQKQEIFFGPNDSRKLQGKITYISELADPKTHTTRLEITVDNSKGLLRSGQMVYARLTRRVLKNVIMIPLKAVVPLERGYVVYLSSSGRAVRRDIMLDTSMFRGELIGVTRGLVPGERLILEPNVGPGQAIQEVPDAAE
jgi:membrane fusion protein (multidrug efflux system)